MKWNSRRFNTRFDTFWGQLKGLHRPWGYEQPAVNKICVVELFLLNLPQLRKLEKQSLSVRLTEQ